MRECGSRAIPLNMSVVPAANQKAIGDAVVRDEAADEEIIAAVDRGEFVSNRAVCEWIASWATGDERPRPMSGD